MAVTERGAIVVVGATGFVGSRLARSLLARGESVVAVGRDRGGLTALSRHLPTYHADLTDPALSAVTASRITADVGPPRAVVAALGGWYVEAEAVDVTLERWEGTLRSNLTTHFVSAQAFAPILGGDDPSYIALNGIASHYPCVGSVAVCAAGAAQRMLIDVLAAEAIGRIVRFHELTIDTPVLEPGTEHATDEPTHTTDEVCDAVVRMIGDPGLRGTRRVTLG